MRIAYITAGAAGTICGNCLKDNALAAALKQQGHSVLLLSAYTPILTDEIDVSSRKVVFSGINLYLQGKYKFFRSSSLLDFLFDHPRLLSWVSRTAIETRPENLGAMTVATMQGDEGPHSREMGKLLDVLKAFNPEVVHLTNSMFASMAEPIRRTLGIPVICSLQGEDVFLDSLPSPYTETCYELLRKHASSVDMFVSPCQDHAAAMADKLNSPAGSIAVILPGISLDGYQEWRGSGKRSFTVGYLARVSENKGLHLLAEAVSILRQEHPEQNIRLLVAGWRGDWTSKYLEDARQIFDFEDCGYLPRKEKLSFLSSLDAFSVPVTYRAPKGMYMLEALAAGVPVVQPCIGIFPELLEATAGGLACQPADSRDLASKLSQLMLDRPQSRHMGIKGQEAVRLDFSSERMAVETIALYQQLTRV